MIRISVIVPMYNVEAYVEQCLLSCVHQNLPASEYEVIVVDDGSPDHSFEIAEALQKQYPHIRIIRQPNQGLSMARNNGLAIAQGEYVWFVDSDDHILPDCLLTICQTMDASDAPILRIDAAFDDQPARGQCRCSGSRSWEEALGVDFEPCVPFHIFRRSFLSDHHLSFTPKIYFEDSEFTPRAYRAAGHIQYLPETLYFVRANALSITHTANPKKAFDALFIAIKQQQDFLPELRQGCPVISYHIAHNIKSALDFIADADEEQRRSFMKNLKQHRHLLCHFFLTPRWDYRLYGMLVYVRILFA